MVLAHSPPRKAANTRPPDRNRRNLTRISETPTDIITQQSPPPLPTTSRAGHSRSHSPRISPRSPPPRGRAQRRSPLPPLPRIDSRSPTNRQLSTPPPSPSRGWISLPSTPSSRQNSPNPPREGGEDEIPASWESLSPSSMATPALVYSPPTLIRRSPSPATAPTPAIAPTPEPAPAPPTALQTAFMLIVDSAKEIMAKISEGKSVTSANKKRIKDLAQNIMGAVEMAKYDEPPELTKPVSDAVLQTIRETIREELKAQAPPLPPPAPTPVPLTKSFASVAATTPPPKRPAPRSPVQPAMIIKAKATGEHQPVVYDEWRKKITFRNSTFAPSQVRTLRNNTVKVNFDNAAQRDEIVARVNRIPGLVAEESRLRKPLIILKGVSKETPKEELLDIISSQNQVAVDDLRLCFLLKNRNDKFYNVVLEVAPAVRRTFVEEGRVNVEHQRVHVADFSRFVQCRKCLQFGHTGNKCEAEFYPCAHCGSAAHHISTCSHRTDPTKMCCYNCKQTNSTNTKHSALDTKVCPKILKAQKSLNESTDYGY
ncbi:uncharacterized protein Rv2082-like [Plodia interpunctella]|uniref:uncharacterized protein Rv2082-like n=1 Tax=Plodia interpunctella TaxID=58824 RepID=UPI002367B54A|nr:uncharacterized protein Rv2082-like [Plodia interpunctella]